MGVRSQARQATGSRAGVGCSLPGPAVQAARHRCSRAPLEPRARTSGHTHHRADTDGGWAVTVGIDSVDTPAVPPPPSQDAQPWVPPSEFGDKPRADGPG